MNWSPCSKSCWADNSKKLKVKLNDQSHETGPRLLRRPGTREGARLQVLTRTNHVRADVLAVEHKRHPLRCRRTQQAAVPRHAVLVGSQ